MLIRITKPSGVAPKIEPTELNESFAELALDCRLDGAGLRALEGVSNIRVGWGGPYQSIYRFGQDVVNDETLYWFRATGDVNWVRGTVFGDTRELTFYTDGSELKYTTNTIALAGEPYPSNHFEIFDKPVGALALTGTTGTGSGVDQTFTYVQTLLTPEGFETRPSDPITVTGQSGQTFAFDLIASPAGPYNYGAGALKRIYRSTSVDTLSLRGQVLETATTFSDTVDGVGLGELLTTPYNLKAPTGMFGLVTMQDSFTVGFLGRDVYPSKFNKPYAYPQEYALTCEYEIVGGVVFGGSTLVVGTKGWPVVIQGTDPSSLQPTPLHEFKHACASKPSMVAVLDGCLYAAPDGLAYISLVGKPKLVTGELFTPEQWRALYKPSSIRAFNWQDKYVGFYDNGTKAAGFIFDPADPKEPFIDISLHATGGYFDPLYGGLYLSVGQDLVKFAAGALLTSEWWSKQFILPRPACMTAMQIYATDYTDMVASFVADGVVVQSVPVIDSEPFRIEEHNKARIVQIRVTGGRWQQIDAATSMRELADG